MSKNLVIDNCTVEIHHAFLPSQWAVTSGESGDHDTGKEWFVYIYLDGVTLKFQVEPGTTREAIAAEVGLPL